MAHNSVHIKLEYDNALFVKKSALLLEKSLLETVRYIRAYNNLKKSEAVIKEKIKRDMVVLGSLVSSLESDLPREEAEEIDKTGPRKTIELELTKKKVERKVIEHKKSEVEQEIDKIREKLAALGGEDL